MVVGVVVVGFVVVGSVVVGFAMVSFVVVWLVPKAGDLREVYPTEARAWPSFAASESREALLRAIIPDSNNIDPPFSSSHSAAAMMQLSDESKASFLL